MTDEKRPWIDDTATPHDDEAPDEEDATSVGVRLAALRLAVGLSQVAVAKRLVALNSVDSRIAAIVQPELSKFEKGRLKASTTRVMRSLAAAYDITIDDLDRYMGGVLTLADLLAIRSRGLAAKSPHDTYRKHPRWDTLVAEARALRRYLRPATFEAFADTPVVGGTLATLSAQVVADLADAVQRHLDAEDDAARDKG